jgi:DNA polymerase-1
MDYITVDLETTGLSWLTDKIILIGYRLNGQGPVKHIDFSSGDRGPAEFINALADPNVVKRGHNVKFDAQFLLANGYQVNGTLDCTSVLCYLENPFRSTRLKDLVEEKLQRKVQRIDDVLDQTRIRLALPKNRKVPYELVAIDEWKPYNEADVVNCDDIRHSVNPSSWYYDVEQPLIRVFLEMEQRGINLDINYLQELKCDYGKEIEELEKTFGGVNPRSPKQVSAQLQADGSISASQGTDKLVLKKLSWNGGQYARRLLRYREVAKLQSTYVTPLIVEADPQGRIHGSFNQAGSEQGTNGTKTGRATSSGPNLQNIPSRTKEGKKIRRAFIPSKGLLMFDSDLKQIEPRLVAHYSQSPSLLHAYANNIDTHSLFASNMLGKPIESIQPMERFVGKTGGLATVYGCSAKKLVTISETYSDVPLLFDEQFFKDVQHKFWLANPEIKSWRNQEIAQARALGFIRTIGGRVIRIPNLHSKDWRLRAEAERQVINYKIQGSAADIMKLILVRLHKELRDWGWLLAVVHDEALGEFDPELIDPDLALDIINDCMSNTVKLNGVAIEADTKIINNWSEKA